MAFSNAQQKIISELIFKANESGVLGEILLKVSDKYTMSNVFQEFSRLLDEVEDYDLQKRFELCLDAFVASFPKI